MAPGKEEAIGLSNVLGSLFWCFQFKFLSGSFKLQLYWNRFSEECINAASVSK